MEEPEKIIEVLEAFFARQQDLAGRKIVITAGPTARKLTRCALSAITLPERWVMPWPRRCASRGAEVVLVKRSVTPQTVHPNIQRIDVESAAEMHRAAADAFKDADAGNLVCGRSGLHTGAGGRPENQTGKRTTWCCG